MWRARVRATAGGVRPRLSATQVVYNIVALLYSCAQSLAQRIKAFGIDAPDTIKQWKKLNTEYNVAAMKMLQSDDFETVMICARASTIGVPTNEKRDTNVAQ